MEKYLHYYTLVLISVVENVTIVQGVAAIILIHCERRLVYTVLAGMRVTDKRSLCFTGQLAKVMGKLSYYHSVNDKQHYPQGYWLLDNIL